MLFALLRSHDDVDHHHNGDDIGDEIREVRAQVFLDVYKRQGEGTAGPGAMLPTRTGRR